MSHYIALHDTVLFENHDENEAQASRRKETLFDGLPVRQGLKVAVQEFLESSEGLIKVADF